MHVSSIKGRYYNPIKEELVIKSVARERAVTTVASFTLHSHFVVRHLRNLATECLTALSLSASRTQYFAPLLLVLTALIVMQASRTDT